MTLTALSSMPTWVIIVAIAQIVLFIFTIWHIFTHPNYKRGNRVLWTVVSIVLMGFVGPILYFALGRGTK